MTTGIFANVKVGLSKVLKDLGINFNDDPMVNAEAYMAASARRTLAIMPALGAGSALSDADREYAERYVGGKITMSEDAIRKLMDINVRYSKGYVEDYNKDIGKLREWTIKNQPDSALLLNMDPVEMPEIGSFVKDQEAPKITLTPEKQAKFRERLKRERGE